MKEFGVSRCRDGGCPHCKANPIRAPRGRTADGAFWGPMGRFRPFYLIYWPARIGRYHLTHADRDALTARYLELVAVREPDA